MFTSTESGTAGASNQRSDGQGDGNRDHGRAPEDEAAEHARPVAAEQERREERDHEEHEGVQQREDAQPRNGLDQEIDRQPGRAFADARRMPDFAGQQERFVLRRKCHGLFASILGVPIIPRDGAPR